MRNSFALSKLLSDKGIIVKIAKDGQMALEILDDSLDVDLILMDIMMPVMDGYETMSIFVASVSSMVCHFGPYRQGDEERPREMFGSWRR